MTLAGSKIAVVDSGVANLASVLYALERLDAQPTLTADPAIISTADKVLLPGVGAAPRAMELLRARGLVDCLRELKQPVLGICLGMQLLFTGSEEGPGDCLGIISGQVRKFRERPDLVIPQMGWNQIAKVAGRAQALLAGIPNGTNFYFVHSYCAPPGDYTAATCDYGETFSAVAEQANFLGVQFHPERSGEAGARLLKNFLEL